MEKPGKADTQSVSGTITACLSKITQIFQSSATHRRTAQ